MPAARDTTQAKPAAVPEDAAVRGDGALVELLLSSVERSTADSARYRAQMEGRISSARNRVDCATKKLARATDLAQQNYVSAQARDEANRPLANPTLGLPGGVRCQAESEDVPNPTAAPRGMHSAP